MVKINEKIKRTTVLLLCMAIAVCFAACKPDGGGGGGGGGGGISGDNDDYYVTSFEITQNPARLDFFVGEIIDLSGIDVKISWNDGVVWTLGDGDIALTDLTVRPRIMSEDTEKVEIIFDEYTKELAINAASADSLEIASAPSKVLYEVGEYFDPEGLVISAMVGEKEIFLDNFDYYPNGELAADDKVITIACGGTTLEVPITVSRRIFFREAEACEFVNVSNKMTVRENHAMCVNASGKAFVWDPRTGDQLKFTINSDYDCKAALILRVASDINKMEKTDPLPEGGTQRDPAVVYDMQINLVYEITVNGVKVNIGDDAVAKGEVTPGGSYDNWTRWREVEVGETLLHKGENEIVLTIIGSIGFNTYNVPGYGSIDWFTVVSGDLAE